MDSQCLYQAARLEAEAYRVALAGRAGSGFGDEAISEWNRLHWWSWVCDRVLEHVRGDVFWAELDASRFAAWRDANGSFSRIADEIRSLRDRLAGPLDELAFDVRQRMEDRLAELVNQLLD
ncbi:MAG: hypothetical protein AB7K09_12895 [Planctomycetota bacterium]